MKGSVDLFLNWDPVWSGASMPSEAEAERVLGEADEGAHLVEASRQKQRQERTQGAKDCHGCKETECITQRNSSQSILVSAKSPGFLGKVFHFHIGVYIKNEEIKLTGTIFFCPLNLFIDTGRRKRI